MRRKIIKITPVVVAYSNNSKPKTKPVCHCQFCGQPLYEIKELCDYCLGMKINYDNAKQKNYSGVTDANS